MDKKKTPASSVVFYIIGIILLIVALFMLWTAVSYTKAYLQSYDASFKDMWSNSLQYIITQFVPYLGMGVICLGLGRAISGSAAAKAANSADNEVEDFLPAAAKAAEPAEEEPADAQPVESRVAADQVEDLIRRIDANREVLSIKIEEKEKRDSVRLQKLEKKVENFLSDVMYINEPLEELVNKQAGIVTDEEPADTEADALAVGPMPQIFRVARNMTAPACPVVKAAVGLTPQIFRVARNMTAPACPVIGAAEAAEAEALAVGPTPQIFRVARNMTAPACPAVAAAEAAEASAVGPTPQIFRVARNMTMPSC